MTRAEWIKMWNHCEEIRHDATKIASPNKLDARVIAIIQCVDLIEHYIQSEIGQMTPGFHEV